MRRRSLLGLLAAGCSGVGGGCLGDGSGDGTTDDGAPDADDDLPSSEARRAYEDDPAKLFDTHDHGIPREVGEELTQLRIDRLAFTVETAAEAERVFTQEDVAEEYRERNRAFLDATDFGSEVLLQIEEVVPESSIYLAPTSFRLDGSTATVAYEERHREETATALVTVDRLLFRVDVRAGGVSGFEIVRGDETFSPRSSTEL